MQEVQHVIGILPRGIQADGERNGTMTLYQDFEALPEQGVASSRHGEGQLLGGRLEVVAEEDGIMAVACGVKADTNAANGWRSGRGLW